ncbi:CAP domain-containing protein [Sphingomonas qomolangmaensis]|uniref:CAP domain-containing protein n=1 Tax=Sphingomonas qomolangmaensis TaxID=2918765 RepID=UPI0038730501
MLPGSSCQKISRRGFLAGSLALASAPLAGAVPISTPPWLAYGDRLLSRLADAGGGDFDCDFAQALLDEANRFRSVQGLPILVWDGGLAVTAEAHAADMCARGYFQHISPEGFSHGDRVSLLARDFCGQTAENLAWRFHQTQSTKPSKIQAMWEASPAHRENLLNSSFRSVGFGVVRIAGKIYVAGVYGNVAVRLGQALPFRLRLMADIEGAIATSTPYIDSLSLSTPRVRTTSMTRPGQALPTLSPGVWQFRPLRMSGDNRYHIIPGPLFQFG